MKITPPTTYKPRDHALLTPGNRSLTVETVHGCQTFTGKRDVTNALAKLKGFTCYVVNLLGEMKYTTGAKEWTLDTWRGRGTKMTHGPTGTAVTSLRSTLSESKDPFADLTECLVWLRGFAISPASISSMSWKLLRASLSRDVTIGFDPDVSERAMFGGRQQIWQPDHYFTPFKSLDIKAAYPTAMSARPIALSLREVSRFTTIDPTQAGLAHAKVFVPMTLPHAPLPVRVGPATIQFQYHELEGVWSWAEIDAAKRLGCDVKIQQCWAPARTYDLFGPWWDLAREGRELSPGAAKLAKAIANSTWGQFAMKGEERVEMHWSDDKGKEPYEVVVPARNMPHRYMVHVAAEITARVRTQTLMEGLYSCDGYVIHCDTDGIIVHESAPLPANAGDGFGQWRVKEEINQIEVRAPQFYRYTLANDPFIWHFVAAGMNVDGARRAFKTHHDVRTNISFLSEYDVNFPSARSHDAGTLKRLNEEAKQLGVAV